MSIDKKIHGTGDFVPGAVKIVDYDSENNNLLVRGSAAFGAENFSMEALIEAIQADKHYDGNKMNISTDSMIVDFCLIGFGADNKKDKRIVQAEAEWFDPKAPEPVGVNGSYPTIIKGTAQNGVMVYWPVLSIGGTVPTQKGDNWDQAAAVGPCILNEGTGYYNFAGLVPTVYAALTNSATYEDMTSIKNAIIYVHCDSGVNRTGAVIISYLMQYGSNVTSFNISRSTDSLVHTLGDAQKAAAVNPPNNNTPPGGVDQGVAEAYCNYLHSPDKNPTDDLNANCVPNSGTVN